MKKQGFLFFVICIFVVTFSISAFAHSGRTDSSGGHRDNMNRSGLGSYHYHCGGHPPHLHNDGECPYESDRESSYSSSPKSAVTKRKNPENVPSETEDGGIFEKILMFVVFGGMVVLAFRKNW